jgi:secondary thiamine-phosphate synthase enzyme
MKICSEQVTLQTKKAREVVTITNRIKAAMEKNAFRDGMILASSLYSHSAVIVNDEERELLEVVDTWLRQLAPPRDDYKHQGRFESNSAVHFQSLLLRHEAALPFSEGRLGLDPWQTVLFRERDGPRPKRIVVKVMGEWASLLPQAEPSVSGNHFPVILGPYDWWCEICVTEGAKDVRLVRWNFMQRRANDRSHPDRQGFQRQKARRRKSGGFDFLSLPAWEDLRPAGCEWRWKNNDASNARHDSPTQFGNGIGCRF